MSEHKIKRSRTRGPGALNQEEAGTLRNALSQVKTSNNKRKFEVTLAVDAGVGLRNVSQELAGSGGIKGGFLDARHKFSPKGRPYGPLGQATLNKVYTPNGAATSETMCRTLMPKYNVGPGHTVGMNCCPKVYNTKQTVALGLMEEFRAPLNPQRAQRLADHGVSTLLVFEAELSQQNNESWLAQQAAASAAAGGGAAGAAAAAAIPPPAPPTIDEIKAALQLSVLYAWDNRNQAPGARRGVTKTRNVQGL